MRLSGWITKVSQLLKHVKIKLTGQNCYKMLKKEHKADSGSQKCVELNYTSHHKSSLELSREVTQKMSLEITQGLTEN